MFHPVGPQPPSVYWRRRLVVLGSVVVLIVLLAMTLKVLASDGDDPAGAGNDKANAAASGSPPGKTSGASSKPATSSTRRTASSSRASTSSPASSRATPACTANALSVAAVTGKGTYKVGDQPLLELQVTNTGAKPCTQDLADSQVELKVYNGESRVWGSHDCKIQPGRNPRTLTPDSAVRVAITWSGLSSRPGCAGTRQRVGAGTYTLYAVLSGKTGRATQFSIG
jgi:hypothetical protein